MSLLSNLALPFLGFTTLVGGWFGWQLLRQNGRLLLRLEELEERLNELEFGEGEEPAGLPVGSAAPEFDLPDLSGQRHSLAQYRGQPLLLLFFNPGCGFCRQMLPKLVMFRSFSEPGRADLPVGPDAQQCVPTVIILTTGDAEKNRQLFTQHKVGCPVLLQSEGEVAKTYQAHGTPSGYLISAEGKIASPLAMGAEALLALAKGGSESRLQPVGRASADPNHAAQTGDPSAGEPAKAGTPNGVRVPRFGNRSLERSKIKRDGLRAGTPAPDFRLPRLDGKGDLSLSDLRGKRVVLVFSSPGCGPCNALTPELEKFWRGHNRASPPGSAVVSTASSEGMSPTRRRDAGAPVAITVVMISKGEPKENRAKVREHGLTFPVLLQQQWEISRRYAMFATPIAYLIDERGVIAHDVAVGVDQIRELMAHGERLRDESQLVLSVAGRRDSADRESRAFS